MAIINLCYGTGNVRGVPYTDYVFTASQAWAIPVDAVAIQACAISAGGTGGNHPRANDSQGGGSGAGSGRITNGAKTAWPAGNLTVTVPSAGSGGNASVSGGGIATVTATGGGHGAGGVGANTTPGAAGGDGGAGGGGGAGGLFTATSTQGANGWGGNGHNSTGSEGVWGGLNGGNGGAYGGPNGPVGVRERAVTTQGAAVFKPFGDNSVPVYLLAYGGDGAPRSGNPPAGYGGGMNALSGTGYGQGGNGGSFNVNPTAGGQGVVVIRVFWE